MTNMVIAPKAQVSGTLGDLAGSTPASGTARYYATDHLGSTRSAWDGSKVAVGTYEFDPYGGEYNHTGAALDTLAGAYTGKPWDASTKLFHFPYRQYSPDMARWTTRDPLGMVDGPNVYEYVQSDPMNHKDPLGLSMMCTKKPENCKSCKKTFGRGWYERDFGDGGGPKCCKNYPADGCEECFETWSETISKCKNKACTDAALVALSGCTAANC